MQDRGPSWFCVEDLSHPSRPEVVLADASLAECHRFIEADAGTGPPRLLRINYTPTMRRYIATTFRDAA